MLEANLEEARQAQLLRDRHGAIRRLKLRLGRLELGDGLGHIHILQIAELKRQACRDA